MHDKISTFFAEKVLLIPEASEFMIEMYGQEGDTDASESGPHR